MLLSHSIKHILNYDVVHDNSADKIQENSRFDVNKSLPSGSRVPRSHFLLFFHPKGAPDEN